MGGVLFFMRSVLRFRIFKNVCKKILTLVKYRMVPRNFFTLYRAIQLYTGAFKLGKRRYVPQEPAGAGFRFYSSVGRLSLRDRIVYNVDKRIWEDGT